MIKGKQNSHKMHLYHEMPEGRRFSQDNILKDICFIF